MNLPGQTIRFCTSADGARIAFATVGGGPPLVKAANWLNHLEFDWNSPVWRHWLRELGRDHTLVRYDERGCGLSDWSAGEMSVDAWVRDLEAVADALELERFALLGISQGAPIAIAFAVRHPERVSHLVLYGGYLRGRLHRGLTPKEMEERELMLHMVRVGWGQDHPAFRQVFTTLFIPDADREQIDWFNELQRVSATPENAARMLEAFDRIDVRSLASRVRAPTLVLHAKGDLRVPFAEGRLIATTIPGARFVPLDSRNHLLLEGEPAWPRFLRSVREFLGVPSEGSGVRLPLTPERRRQVEGLFDEVADLPPAERAAILERAAAADPGLRREVEGLLSEVDDAAMTSALAGLVSRVMRRREQEANNPGERVGSYEIQEQLGSGGMGVVFRALDRRLNRPVALKFLPATVGAEPQLRQRFLQEAKAAASLDHINICTIYGVEQAPDGRLFLVMPYYEGETLQGRIRRGPLPVAEALDYARQLARGLGHAHAAGIVHRDIKPANVTITRNGQVKILDFGIAKMADASLTRTGMVLGTLAYMSPEQASGEKQVDHRTDLWALGVVLYEMLAGRRPFAQDTIAALFHAVQALDPLPLIEIRPEVSPALQQLVTRLLQKQRDQRYPDAAALLEALDSVEPVRAG
jgi:pimeloyl-ACP methyl ester carboxylesterase